MALSHKDSTPIFSDATSGTVRLIAYLAFAAILMVFDHRDGLLTRARNASAALIVPIYKLAAMPADLIRASGTALAQRQHLLEDNRRLREALLLAEARLNRMQAVTSQNARLKQLLDTQQLLDMHAQLARLIDVQIDPNHDRILLNVGAKDGVQVGQVVIDAHGVMGQVIETLPNAAVALLIVDPDHALPVMVERTGLRGIAYGTGRLDRMLVPNLPLSSDIKPGDQLVTSGLGGRFPAGFPVATITRISPAPSGLFLEAMAKPAAGLERSGEVLLLRDLPDPVGPPAAAPLSGPPNSLAPARAARHFSHTPAASNGASP